MVPKKRVVITGIVAIALLVYAAVGFSNYFASSEDRRMQQLGEELMDQVDAFKAQNHRLPTSLTEIGLETFQEGFKYKDEGFYYTRMNDSIYIIEYAAGVDKNMSCFSNARGDWNESRVVIISH